MEVETFADAVVPSPPGSSPIARSDRSATAASTELEPSEGGAILALLVQPSAHTCRR